MLFTVVYRRVVSVVEINDQIIIHAYHLGDDSESYWRLARAVFKTSPGC